MNMEDSSLFVGAGAGGSSAGGGGYFNTYVGYSDAEAASGGANNAVFGALRPQSLRLEGSIQSLGLTLMALQRATTIRSLAQAHWQQPVHSHLQQPRRLLDSRLLKLYGARCTGSMPSTSASPPPPPGPGSLSPVPAPARTPTSSSLTPQLSQICHPRQRQRRHRHLLPRHAPHCW